MATAPPRHRAIIVNIDTIPGNSDEEEAKAWEGPKKVRQRTAAAALSQAEGRGADVSQ
jgi:hypothetical protein